ncbi:mucin-2-like isoform X2 [Ornithodoros turicata]|uniref:mucin-2-like isoform X2 n=1 Tax=Ornithodoros turicata TaxID=34597 RepID=UPI00313887D9
MWHEGFTARQLVVWSCLFGLLFLAEASTVRQHAGKSSNSTCNEDTNFACRSDPKICIALARVRDGSADCPDASDEACYTGEFQCRSSYFCIPERRVQDGWEDCPDGSDETCQSDQHRCRCGFPRCIDATKVGDGVRDCLDGSDEDEAKGKAYKCPNDGSLQDLMAMERRRRSDRRRGARHSGLMTFTVGREVPAESQTESYDDSVVHPTGLLTTLTGSEVNGDRTTLYTTEVRREYVRGTYTQVLESHSSVLDPAVSLNEVLADAVHQETTHGFESFGSLSSGKVFQTAVNELASSLNTEIKPSNTEREKLTTVVGLNIRTGQIGKLPDSNPDVPVITVTGTEGSLVQGAGHDQTTYKVFTGTYVKNDGDSEKTYMFFFGNRQVGVEATPALAESDKSEHFDIRSGNQKGVVVDISHNVGVILPTRTVTNIQPTEPPQSESLLFASGSDGGGSAMTGMFIEGSEPLSIEGISASPTATASTMTVTLDTPVKTATYEALTSSKTLKHTPTLYRHGRKFEPTASGRKLTNVDGMTIITDKFFLPQHLGLYTTSPEGSPSKTADDFLDVIDHQSIPADDQSTSTEESVVMVMMRRPVHQVPPFPFHPDLLTHSPSLKDIRATRTVGSNSNEADDDDVGDLFATEAEYAFDGEGNRHDTSKGSRTRVTLFGFVDFTTSISGTEVVFQPAATGLSYDFGQTKFSQPQNVYNPFNIPTQNLDENLSSSSESRDIPFGTATREFISKMSMLTSTFKGGVEMQSTMSTVTVAMAARSRGPKVEDEDYAVLDTPIFDYSGDYDLASNFVTSPTIESTSVVKPTELYSSEVVSPKLENASDDTRETSTESPPADSQDLTSSTPTEKFAHEAAQSSAAAKQSETVKATPTLKRKKTHKTGLVSSTSGTDVNGDLTTEWTTLIIGTVISGRYAHVIRSTSSIYSGPLETEIPSTTETPATSPGLVSPIDIQIEGRKNAPVTEPSTEGVTEDVTEQQVETTTSPPEDQDENLDVYSITSNFEIPLINESRSVEESHETALSGQEQPSVVALSDGLFLSTLVPNVEPSVTSESSTIQLLTDGFILPGSTPSSEETFDIAPTKSDGHRIITMGFILPGFDQDKSFDEVTNGDGLKVLTEGFLLPGIDDQRPADVTDDSMLNDGVTETSEALSSELPSATSFPVTDYSTTTPLVTGTKDTSTGADNKVATTSSDVFENSDENLKNKVQDKETAVQDHLLIEISPTPAAGTETPVPTAAEDADTSSLVVSRDSFSNEISSEMVKSSDNPLPPLLEPSPATGMPTTYFTTFTYYSTIKLDGSDVVSTREEVVSNVVTHGESKSEHEKTPETQVPLTSSLETPHLHPTTYFTTYTYWTTLFKDGTSTVVSNLETVSNVENDVRRAEPSTSSQASLEVAPSTAEPVTTFYTTYTYYTTFLSDGTPTVTTREEILSNTMRSGSTLAPTNEEATDTPSTEVSATPTMMLSTYYTTYTYYTTLVRGGSTTVRNRTHVTSKVKTIPYTSEIITTPVVSTYYTTYTYFTTLFRGGSKSVKSRESVKTNVVTKYPKTESVSSTPPVQVITTFTTLLSPVTVYRNGTPRVSFLVRTSPITVTLGATPEPTEQVVPRIKPTATSSQPSYYTTFFRDGTPVVSTLGGAAPTAETNTPELAPSVKTFYTTYTFFTTLNDNGTPSVSRREQVVTNYVTMTPHDVVKPVSETAKQTEHTRSPSSSETPALFGSLPSGLDLRKLLNNVPVTKYTTYTYYTTFYRGDSTVLSSRTEVVSNVMTPTPTSESGTTSTVSYSATAPLGAPQIVIRNKRNAGEDNLHPAEARGGDVIATPVTYYTTYTYFTTYLKPDGNTVVDSSLDIRSSVVYPDHTIRPTRTVFHEHGHRTEPVRIFPSHQGGCVNCRHDTETIYTTYTDYITEFRQGRPVTSTRYHTVTRYVTVTPGQTVYERNRHTQVPVQGCRNCRHDPQYTTFTYFTTKFIEGRPIISTRYETVTNYVTVTVTEHPVDQRIRPTEPYRPVIIHPSRARDTVYTTYTYFTTKIIQGRPIVSTRYETLTNYVTVTVTQQGVDQRIRPTDTYRPVVIHPTPIRDTVYTTYTYFTTRFIQGRPSVSTRYHTVTDYVTITVTERDRIRPTEIHRPIYPTRHEQGPYHTAYTTYTYYTTRYINGRPEVNTRYETVTNVATVTITENATPEVHQRVRPTQTGPYRTYHTTYTYFTTRYVDGSAIVNTRKETVTNTVLGELCRTCPVDHSRRTFIESRRQTAPPVVVTRTAAPHGDIHPTPTTYYTTYTYFTTLLEGGRPVVSTRYETYTDVVSGLVLPTRAEPRPGRTQDVTLEDLQVQQQIVRVRREASDDTNLVDGSRLSPDAEQANPEDVRLHLPLSRAERDVSLVDGDAQAPAREGIPSNEFVGTQENRGVDSTTSDEQPQGVQLFSSGVEASFENPSASTESTRSLNGASVHDDSHTGRITTITQGSITEAYEEPATIVAQKPHKSPIIKKHQKTYSKAGHDVRDKYDVDFKFTGRKLQQFEEPEEPIKRSHDFTRIRGRARIRPTAARVFTLPTPEALVNNPNHGFQAPEGDLLEFRGHQEDLQDFRVHGVPRREPQRNRAIDTSPGFNGFRPVRPGAEEFVVRPPHVQDTDLNVGAPHSLGFGQQQHQSFGSGNVPESPSLPPSSPVLEPSLSLNDYPLSSLGGDGHYIPSGAHAKVVDVVDAHSLSSVGAVDAVTLSPSQTTDVVGGITFSPTPDIPSHLPGNVRRIKVLRPSGGVLPGDGSKKIRRIKITRTFSPTGVPTLFDDYRSPARPPFQQQFVPFNQFVPSQNGVPVSQPLHNPQPGVLRIPQDINIQGGPAQEIGFNQFIDDRNRNPFQGFTPNAPFQHTPTAHPPEPIVQHNQFSPVVPEQNHFSPIHPVQQFVPPPPPVHNEPPRETGLEQNSFTGERLQEHVPEPVVPSSRRTVFKRIRPTDSKRIGERKTSLVRKTRPVAPTPSADLQSPSVDPTHIFVSSAVGDFSRFIEPTGVTSAPVSRFLQDVKPESASENHDVDSAHEDTKQPEDEGPHNNHQFKKVIRIRRPGPGKNGQRRKIILNRRPDAAGLQANDPDVKIHQAAVDQHIDSSDHDPESTATSKDTVDISPFLDIGATVPLTYYTTFTYLTTFLHGTDTVYNSREAVLSTVVTVPLNTDIVEVIQSHGGFTTPSDGVSMVNLGSRTKGAATTIVNLESRLQIFNSDVLKGIIATPTAAPFVSYETASPAIDEPAKLTSGVASGTVKLADLEHLRKTLYTLYTYYYTLIDGLETKNSVRSELSSTVLADDLSEVANSIRHTSITNGILPLGSGPTTVHLGSREVDGTTTEVNLGMRTVVKFDGVKDAVIGDISNHIQPTATYDSPLPTGAIHDTIDILPSSDRSSLLEDALQPSYTIDNDDHHRRNLQATPIILLPINDHTEGPRAKVRIVTTKVHRPVGGLKSGVFQAAPGIRVRVRPVIRRPDGSLIKDDENVESPPVEVELGTEEKHNGASLNPEETEDTESTERKRLKVTLRRPVPGDQLAKTNTINTRFVRPSRFEITTKPRFYVVTRTNAAGVARPTKNPFTVKVSKRVKPSSEVAATPTVSVFYERYTTTTSVPVIFGLQTSYREVVLTASTPVTVTLSPTFAPVSSGFIQPSQTVMLTYFTTTTFTVPYTVGDQTLFTTVQETNSRVVTETIEASRVHDDIPASQSHIQPQQSARGGDYDTRRLYSSEGYASYFSHRPGLSTRVSDGVTLIVASSGDEYATPHLHSQPTTPVTLQPTLLLDAVLMKEHFGGQPISPQPFSVSYSTRTLFTTYTYFTTFFTGDTTSVASSEQVISNTVTIPVTQKIEPTATPQLPEVREPNTFLETSERVITSTSYNTFTFYATLFNGSSSVVTPFEEVQSQVFTITESFTITKTLLPSQSLFNYIPVSSPAFELQPTTQLSTVYSTQTNYITFFQGTSTIVSSIEEVFSDVVTLTVKDGLVSSTPVSSLAPIAVSSTVTVPEYSTRTVLTTQTQYVTFFSGSRTIFSSIEEVGTTVVTEKVGSKSSIFSGEIATPVTSVRPSLTSSWYAPPAPSSTFIQPSSSTSPADLVPSVRTYYTTYTYFTTFFTDSSSIIASRENVVTSHVTLFVPRASLTATKKPPVQTIASSSTSTAISTTQTTPPPPPSTTVPVPTIPTVTTPPYDTNLYTTGTTYTTYTFYTTLFGGQDKIIISSEQVVPKIVTTRKGLRPTTASTRLTPTPTVLTHLTTYTYYTTLVSDAVTVVSSSEEVITQLVSTTIDATTSSTFVPEVNIVTSSFYTPEKKETVASRSTSTRRPAVSLVSRVSSKSQFPIQTSVQLRPSVSSPSLSLTTPTSTTSYFTILPSSSFHPEEETQPLLGMSTTVIDGSTVIFFTDIPSGADEEVDDLITSSLSSVPSSSQPLSPVFVPSETVSPTLVKGSQTELTAPVTSTTVLESSTRYVGPDNETTSLAPNATLFIITGTDGVVTKLTEAKFMSRTAAVVPSKAAAPSAPEIIPTEIPVVHHPAPTFGAGGGGGAGSGSDATNTAPSKPIKPGTIIDLADVIGGSANLGGNIGEAIKGIVHLLSNGKKQNDTSEAVDLKPSHVNEQASLPPVGATVSQFEEPVYIPVGAIASDSPGQDTQGRNPAKLQGRPTGVTMFSAVRSSKQSIYGDQNAHTDIITGAETIFIAPTEVYFHDETTDAPPEVPDRVDKDEHVHLQGSVRGPALSSSSSSSHHITPNLETDAEIITGDKTIFFSDFDTFPVLTQAAKGQTQGAVEQSSEDKVVGEETIFFPDLPAPPSSEPSDIQITGATTIFGDGFTPILPGDHQPRYPAESSEGSKSASAKSSGGATTIFFQLDGDRAPILPSVSTVTQYITSVESITRTLTLTTTKVYYTRDSPLTITSVFTTTIAPRTFVSTIIGSRTILGTLPAATASVPAPEPTVKPDPTTTVTTTTLIFNSITTTVVRTVVIPTDQVAPSKTSSVSPSTASVGDAARTRTPQSGDSSTGSQPPTPRPPSRRLTTPRTTPSLFSKRPVIAFRAPTRTTETTSKPAPTGPRPKLPFPKPPPTTTTTPKPTRPPIKKKPSKDIPLEGLAPVCLPRCNDGNYEICKEALDGTWSCECKPGYGRQEGNKTCAEIETYVVVLRVVKMGESAVSYRTEFSNSLSSEFQEIADVAKKGISDAVKKTDVEDQFVSSNLNSISEAGDLDTADSSPPGILLNFTVAMRKGDKITPEVIHEQLSRSLRQTNYSIGQSVLYVSPSAEGVAAVKDFDECEHPDLNDCARLAKCVNLPGTYSCYCKDGFQDLDPLRPGRICSGEIKNCDHCNARGTCVISDEGKKSCRCNRMFLGRRCEINGLVLAIALPIALALLVVMVCAMVCLCRRWKRRTKRAKGPFGMGAASPPGGTLDKKAMITDTSSESSGEHALKHSYAFDGFMHERVPISSTTQEICHQGPHAPVEEVQPEERHEPQQKPLHGIQCPPRCHSSGEA